MYFDKDMEHANLCGILWYIHLYIKFHGLMAIVYSNRLKQTFTVEIVSTVIRTLSSSVHLV